MAEVRVNSNISLSAIDTTILKSIDLNISNKGPFSYELIIELNSCSAYKNLLKEEYSCDSNRQKLKFVA